MNKYLLLRDNKQQGPFTAEELAAKGLKAYDLVWVEGRSAAWRYPSEIDELKSFAPVVEEQPYDRFYKKPSDQQGNNQAVQATQAETKKTVQAVAETAIAEEQAVAGPVSQTEHTAVAKHIYVTMPVMKGSTGNTTTPVAKKEEPKPVTQYNTTQSQQYNQYNSGSSSATKTQEKKAVAASSYIISEDDDELNSSLLAGHQSRKKEDDQISDGYMSDYESRKAAFESKKAGTTPVSKQASTVTAVPKKESKQTQKRDIGFDLKALLAGSGRYLQDNKNLTRSLVAAVLILGGVVIGLVINSGHRQPDTQALESLVKEIRDQQNEKSTTASEQSAETARNNNQQKETDANNENSNSATEPAPPPSGYRLTRPEQSVVREALMKKENNNTANGQNKQQSVAVPVSNTNTEPVENTPVVVSEQPKEKTVSQEMLEKARKNIYDLVHVEPSAFHVGLLGGVSDLDITVLNSSLYPLDQVAVEIKYFGPEKKLVKTQTLVFNNVPAGKRRTLEAPRTNRGISIDYSIISINSKVLGLAQAGY